MTGRGRALRVGVALVLASLPALVSVLLGLALIEGSSGGADPLTAALAIIAMTVVWAAILAVIYSRVLNDDIRALLELARRGSDRDQEVEASAYHRLASSMDERNRQLAELARQVSKAPIQEAPRLVATHVVDAARSVARDHTWRLAVMQSGADELLPPGVYAGAGDPPSPAATGDMERWISTAEHSDGPRMARLLDGPWGAFVVVDVAEADLRAFLYAPWEGRSEPTPAERDLLGLIGQHAGTAIEHALLYARVRSQAEELHRLAAIQTDFLRGVTHDLQTPLTRISALASELSATSAVSTSALEDLAAITHQADRLRRMVSQLLVVSRLEAGALLPNQEVFAIRPIIERTWAALRADRPFSLDIHGVPHLVIGDEDRVEQALWAVLDNAVKYSPAGSAIAVSVNPDDAGSVRVRVTDRGAGMDPETTERAFEQFYRAAEARRLAPDGSGVGLYAVRGLVEMMGGSVQLETRLGHGTSIIISLPSEEAQPTADEVAARPASG